jgi:hypothetical protein
MTAPIFDQHFRLGTRAKPFEAQTLVTELAVEALDDAILPRLPGLDQGEVLNLLEIWRGASFADVNQQTGFGEPGKGAPHGEKATCFASHA